jgi:hypothetical protein
LECMGGRRRREEDGVELTDETKNNYVEGARI